MSATRTFIKAQFKAIEINVKSVRFTEDETIVVKTDTGRKFVMEVGSDDDFFVFADEEGYEVSFEIPEEGFED